jgi:hypothetical protein
VQQDGEALGVERVGFVGLAHAPLGLGRIGEMRAVACLLHLVDHPVPVAGGFEGDLAGWRQRAEKVDVLLPVVLDPDGGRRLALAVDGHEDRELLVRVASDFCWHGALLCGNGCAFIGSPQNGSCAATSGCCTETC